MPAKRRDAPDVDDDDGAERDGHGARKTGAARLRRPEIVRAASEVFLRYGYSRTTMRDIAGASGLSRPALYNSFPGKDEIFAAVVESLSNQNLAEMRAALPELATLESKLHLCCER